MNEIIGYVDVHPIHHRCLPCSAENKICHSETAIKLKSCSLSHPLIKGRYPVCGQAFGSGGTSLTTMHHPDTVLRCCDMSLTGWESMCAAALQPLLRFCDGQPCCLLFICRHGM